MSGSVYKVPGMRRVAIRQSAENIRAAFQLTNVPYYPVMDVLEHILDNRLGLIRLEVCDDGELGGAEGQFFKDDDGVDRIVLPEAVYKGAWQGERRARFTAAHELGHWVLHSRVALQRVHQRQLKGAFEDSEWQANNFAAELLMPVGFISRGDTDDDLCERFGVSAQSAQLRLQALNKEGII